MDLEALTLNGRYDVSRKLQSGYYGTTWLAKDRTNRENVCIKTFFSESEPQKKELAILREMSEGHFSHDNLCRILDVSVDRAPVTSSRGETLLRLQYVVFEYCSGSDLFNFLVTGPFERTQRSSSFPEPLACHYFTQALLAVIYLHERGVFHRDIKPENCVLDEHFNLKLTDFGTNKILPIADDPGRVLRTATKGIGTDSYRAPEVNDPHGYDPSAADVWSLGVTLFFMVGVEVMVEKVKSLDQYTRAVIAPLGIVFPFPILCPKLDSYMRTERDLLLAVRANGGHPLPNEAFWLEWGALRGCLSPHLTDLFNRVFVLVPDVRCTLRDLLRHPWVLERGGRQMTSEDIRDTMTARCPSGIRTSRQASPRVMGNQLLGGVDQATLRQSLSKSSPEDIPEYLTDAELWVMCDALRQLEALQLEIVGCDIQELIMDVNYVIQLLRNVLNSPHEDDRRVLPVKDVPTPWVCELLLVVGYLPQGKLLYLPVDGMNLALLQWAVLILEGTEMAVTQSAVPMATSSDDEDQMITDQSDSSMMEGHVTLHVNKLRKFSSEPELPPAVAIPTGAVAMTIGTMATSLPRYVSMGDSILGSSPPYVSDGSLPGSSQESTAWTQYTTGTLSSQSSQEECPEAMVSDIRDRDYSSVHCVMELTTVVNRLEAKQYRAAAEFCKLSGLLCSYGLYQVVRNEQLVLYCRGNTSSFSARLVALDNQGKIGISSWCFHGNDEWQAILERAERDMTPL